MVEKSWLKGEERDGWKGNHELIVGAITYWLEGEQRVG